MREEGRKEERYHHRPYLEEEENLASQPVHTEVAYICI